MQEDQKNLLIELLHQGRVLSLGVLVDGAPHLGLLPFAMTGDGSALLVHASSLARHSQGLRADAPYSALLHSPDAPDRDPLQIPRLTVQGTVQPIDRQGPEYDEARARYVAKLPGSERIFALGDFQLHALKLDRGRLVQGFARTLDLSPTDFATLASS